MTKKHFVNLASYNLWANTRMTDFISANISDEQASKEIISSFPSVKKTVYHIWDAEDIWIERLRGNSLKEFSSPHYKGSFADGMKSFLQNSTAILEFLKAKEENYFISTCAYMHTSGIPYEQRLTDILTHLFNHNSFHRGQLITMFRQLGFTTGIPATDFIEYTREKDAVSLN